MTIKTFYCNPYRECTYVLTMKQGHCCIVDPGMYGDKEEKRVQEYLNENKLVPDKILITHYHPDHVCGLEFIKRTFPNAKVIDFNNIDLPGDIVKIIPTPGHKEDAVCFYFEKDGVLFSGDTLFLESVGRTDLPGGNTAELMRSLCKLAELPSDTTVYPGHGYPTTMQHEVDCNPFFKS